MSTRNMVVLTDVTSWPDIVHCQPPDDRIEYNILVYFRGRPKLRWYDTVRRDLKAWKIKEEWATDREGWRRLCKTRYPEQGDSGER